VREKKYKDYKGERREREREREQTRDTVKKVLILC
jgi:hypothetical protein